MDDDALVTIDRHSYKVRFYNTITSFYHMFNESYLYHRAKYLVSYKFYFLFKYFWDLRASFSKRNLDSKFKRDSLSRNGRGGNMYVL